MAAPSPYSYDVLVAPKSTLGSIKNWINHDTVDPTQILAEAQAYIYAKLRAREMQVSTTVAGVQDQAWIALPDGFLDPIELKFDGDGEPLEFVHETLLDRVYDPDGTFSSGQPLRWSIFDERIQFDCPVDVTALPYTGRLIYYATPAPLATVTNPTNFLTSRFPTLLRRACLAFGYEARNRADMMQAQLALLDPAIDDANRAADMSRRGQSLRR